jgi:hypothetical protein
MSCGVERWEYEQAFASLAAQGFATHSIKRNHPRDELGEELGRSVLAKMQRQTVSAINPMLPLDMGNAADGPFGGRAPPSVMPHHRYTVNTEEFVHRIFDQVVRLDVAIKTIEAAGGTVTGTVLESAIRRDFRAVVRMQTEWDNARPDHDKYKLDTEPHLSGIERLYARWMAHVDTDAPDTGIDTYDGWRSGPPDANPGADFPLNRVNVYKQYVGYTGTADDPYLLHYELACVLELSSHDACADYATFGGLPDRPGHARVRLFPVKQATPVVEYGAGGHVRFMSFPVRACVLYGPVPTRLRRRYPKTRRPDANGILSMTHAPHVARQVMHGMLFIDVTAKTVFGRISSRSYSDGTTEYEFNLAPGDRLERVCIANTTQRRAANLVARMADEGKGILQDMLDTRGAYASDTVAAAGPVVMGALAANAGLLGAFAAGAAEARGHGYDLTDLLV